MRSLPIGLHEIAGVVPASRIERPAPLMVSSGVAQIDALTGGLPRGGLTEICGAPSSGRTSVMLAVLAAATTRAEICALIDVGDFFDPKSAEASGVNLEKLLWVRCGDRSTVSPHTTTRQSLETDREQRNELMRALEAKQQTGAIMPSAKVWYGRSPARSERASSKSAFDPIRKDQRKQLQTRSPNLAGAAKRVWREAIEQALKAADLVLQSGGFGVVALDMGDVPVEMARRIPLTSWFRFRRAVENTPTVLLTLERESCAKTCASMVLKTAMSNQPLAPGNNDRPSHSRVFIGIESAIEVVRSRVEEISTGKKPTTSSTAVWQRNTMGRIEALH